MKFAADLHSHTCVSDGCLAPEALIALARQRGLEALAVTDHDTLDGYRSLVATGAAEAWAGGAGTPMTPGTARDAGSLRLIPGVELSTDGPRGEIHVLGYFVDPASASLEKALAALREARRRRVTRILEALGRVGISIDLAVSGEGSVGRPHVARALVRAGHARSLKDAFNRFLGSGMPGHVPYRNGLDPAGAVRLVREAGGVASLAHPDLSMADGPFLAELAHAGLGAVEACHPKHDPTGTEALSKAAARLGLLTTGGSDFHGNGEEGAGLGDFGVTRAQLEALAARRGSGA